MPDLNAPQNFTPFEPLPASRLNNIDEDILALSDGSGLEDGAVTPAKRSGGFYVDIIPPATFASTGNKTISGIPFRPKLVRFDILQTNSSGTPGGGSGVADGTNQYVWGFSTGRETSTSHCIIRASAGGGGGVSMRASLVTFTDDGFTINVDVASDANIIGVGYVAYA
jgi:hypothetical protein